MKLSWISFQIDRFSTLEIRVNDIATIAFDSNGFLTNQSKSRKSIDWFTNFLYDFSIRFLNFVENFSRTTLNDLQMTFYEILLLVNFCWQKTTVMTSHRQISYLLSLSWKSIDQKTTVEEAYTVVLPPNKFHQHNSPNQPCWYPSQYFLFLRKPLGGF